MTFTSAYHILMSFAVKMKRVTEARQWHGHWQHSSEILATLGSRTMAGLIGVHTLMPRTAKFLSLQKPLKR